MTNNIKIFTFDEIEAEDIRWLWKPYIALGKITVIQGDPGTGKTTLALAIASLMSKNRRMPTGGLKAAAGNVIFQSGEDSPKDTIKPRLVACNADCSKIAFMEIDDGFDLRMLEEAMMNSKTKLVVIDPLQAFLSASQDITSAKNMRPFLRELSNIAERTGAAMVIIGHMNKNDRTKGIYRGLGSIDITAAARSVLLVGKRKDDESIRFMAQIKNNLTTFGKTVSFTIGKRGGVKFLGECDISENELLSANDSKKSKFQVAEELIITMLSTCDRKSNDIFNACMDAGISISTMNHIKKRLGIKSIRKIDDWYWTMDSDAVDIDFDNSTDEIAVKFLGDATSLQSFSSSAEINANDCDHNSFGVCNNNDISNTKMASLFGEIELLNWIGGS